MVSGMNLLWSVNCIRSFLFVSVIELLAARLTSRRYLSYPFGRTFREREGTSNESHLDHWRWQYQRKAVWTNWTTVRCQDHLSYCSFNMEHSERAAPNERHVYHLRCQDPPLNSSLGATLRCQDPLFFGTHCEMPGSSHGSFSS